MMVLRIDWGGSVGTKWYADRALTSPVVAEGRLLEVGELDLRIAGGKVQAVGDVTIRLSDYDGDVRADLQAVPIERCRAVLYQWFVGTSADDAVPLLVGFVEGPATWREADASVSFDLVDASAGYGVMVGHEVSRSDFSSMPDESAQLPLVFGEVEGLKCVQVTDGLKGILLRELWAADTVAIVEGGEDFPQMTDLGVLIHNKQVWGYFEGKRLYIRDRDSSYTRIYAGAQVRLAGDQPVYIVSTARCKAVNLVQAKKRFVVKDGRTGSREIEQLAEVPADHYTVSLADTTTWPDAGRAICTIEMSTPLTQLPDEGWAGDDIWVDVSGYTSSGGTLLEHPADIIEALLKDFGGLLASQIESFAAAKAARPDWAFAFAQIGQRDLKGMVADLAAQALCQLLVVTGKVYLLAWQDDPGSSALTGADSNAAEGAAELTWTPAEDLKTEVLARYRPDLSGESAKPRAITLRDNTAYEIGRASCRERV
jgi:hypothetical protein